MRREGDPVLLGVGIDLVEIERIARMMENNEPFVDRLLTENEKKRWLQIRRKQRKAEWTAGRFAAKEAFFKALGTGVGGAMGMQDIEIVSTASGKPELLLSPSIRAFLQQPVWCHLSITHTGQTAGAVVIIESRGQSDEIME